MWTVTEGLGASETARRPARVGGPSRSRHGMAGAARIGTAE